ncbi:MULTISPECIES: McrC family protein [Marinobacter]|uniref:McrC family protein n=1 Tax=Marinobacter TaxID=2742 RepID=UPI003B42BBCE|nr:hypothetical protein PBN92_08990 [Marinobacter alkaliphilus]
MSRAKGIPADAFRWGHQTVQWRQFCGVVQLEGLTLEILPKIYGKEAQPGSCRATLIRMLRKAGLMKVHRGAGASIKVQEHSLLDIFIQEFCLLVREQNLIGKPRDYQQFEDNLGVVKGRLLVNQQLRQNLAHRERLYCQYDELTDDIAINQIIKFTLHLLLPQCRSNVSRKAVTELLMQHDGIADNRFISSDLDSIHLNRTNRRYASILDWCRLFLDARSPDVSAGNHALLSILFDMNVLFERWLAAALRPVAHQAGLTVREQQPRKYMAYRPDVDRKVFQTKPDISLIDRNKNVVMVLDAKWKLLDHDDAKLGIAQQDLYQLSAYGNLYGISELALLYPMQSRLARHYPMQLNGYQRLHLGVFCIDVEEGLSNMMEDTVSSLTATDW